MALRATDADREWNGLSSRLSPGLRPPSPGGREKETADFRRKTKPNSPRRTKPISPRNEANLAAPNEAIRGAKQSQRKNDFAIRLIRLSALLRAEGWDAENWWMSQKIGRRN